MRDYAVQLHLLQERLKGTEEASSSLQHKAKELELKLREQEHNYSSALQQVRDLEKKLKEQVQESEFYSLTLQLKIKELEEKLAHEKYNDTILLQQKIRELEVKLKEKVREIECKMVPQNYAEAAGATPIGLKLCLRDEVMSEVDPFILRSSNSSNRMSHGSTLSKRREFANEIRRKREFRSEETENQMPAPSPLPDKKRKSDPPPKPYSRVSKTTRSTTAVQRPTGPSRMAATRDYIHGPHHSTKDKETKKRMWF